MPGDWFFEVCRACGIVRWYHEAGQGQYCPLHAGRMDWDYDTRFVPSGTYITQSEAEDQGRQEQPSRGGA